MSNNLNAINELRALACEGAISLVESEVVCDLDNLCSESETATATTSVVYSIRDDAGRLLACGEYMPSVQDAAYNKACVMNPDRSTTTFTYYVNGKPHYSEDRVCFKSAICAGYPHYYTSIVRDDRCIVDYCYYAWTDAHTIFNSEDEAIDYIMDSIINAYNAMHDEDETFEEFMDSELSYWHITPVKEWRENARVARFGARSVIR